MHLPRTARHGPMKAGTPKTKKGKKCCIESILTSRTEILVLPVLKMWLFE